MNPCTLALLSNLGTEARAYQSVEALQAPSNEHYRLGKFDDAVVQYQKVLTSRPDDPNALYWLGRTLLKKDDVQSAFDLSAKSCNKHPANGHLRSLLGDVLFRQGKFDDAKAAYQNAIKLDVNLVRGHLGLGRVLKTESRYKSALPHLRKAYELDPKDPDVIRQWASVLKSSEEEARLWETYIALATNEDDFTLARVKSSVDVRRKTGFKKLLVLKGEPKANEIKLQSLKNGPREAFGLGLNVRINGGKQLTLHLDTGASGLMIHQRAAEKSGI
ncbi:MAG: tetratricopeptide repeat protein [Acidobacteriota bacterium]